MENLLQLTATGKFFFSLTLAMNIQILFSFRSIIWRNILTGDVDGQIKSNAKTMYSKLSCFPHPRFPFHSILACTSGDSKVNSFFFHAWFVLNKERLRNDN